MSLNTTIDLSQIYPYFLASLVAFYPSLEGNEIVNIQRCNLAEGRVKSQEWGDGAGGGGRG